MECKGASSARPVTKRKSSCAGLHRTAPGVLEQLVDCSGGDIIDEDSGFERKAAALERILKEQVWHALTCPTQESCDSSMQKMPSATIRGDQRGTSV